MWETIQDHWRKIALVVGAWCLFRWPLTWWPWVIFAAGAIGALVANRWAILAWLTDSAGKRYALLWKLLAVSAAVVCFIALYDSARGEEIARRRAAETAVQVDAGSAPDSSGAGGDCDGPAHIRRRLNPRFLRRRQNRDGAAHAGRRFGA